MRLKQIISPSLFPGIGTLCIAAEENSPAQPQKSATTGRITLLMLLTKKLV
jgi:hypothetical protein